MSLTASKNLKMHLMDVVTAYLYGSLDNDIYMKLPEGLKMSGALKEKSREICSVSYIDHYMDYKEIVIWLCDHCCICR